MSRARRGKKQKLGARVAGARVRYHHVGARRVRDVVDLIRGLNVNEAQDLLRTIHRPTSAPMLRRLLKSAFSNANHEGGSYKEEDLIVGVIYVDGGPITWRHRPRAMGRVVPIRKRTSHITVELYSRPGSEA